ncbi:hypothetical protein NDW01_28365 [Actinoallomurus sp. WRP6H-15]|nr:hypothetical protein [Actinoallomurus soli]MCO5972327.1 hypothetical protein [Actinoallomurus soli]
MNSGNDRTTRNAASVTAVAAASPTAVRRGPHRSASRPSGTPASMPTAQPSVSANPTRAGDSPTTRVKNSTEQA